MNQTSDLRPTRGDVAHMRDPRDQRREHQGCNDHLDQAQEQRGDDRQIFRDLFELLCRSGRAVVDRGVGRPTGDDAEDQCEQDVAGKFRGQDA